MRMLMDPEKDTRCKVHFAVWKAVKRDFRRLGLRLRRRYEIGNQCPFALELSTPVPDEDGQSSWARTVWKCVNKATGQDVTVVALLERLDSGWLAYSHKIADPAGCVIASSDAEQPAVLTPLEARLAIEAA